MTLAEQLSDAETSYHKLVTGQSVNEFVDQNGERVRYNPASAPKLAAYIQDLRSRVNAVSTGPMTFWGRP